MGTATTISSRLAQVLNWAVDNSVISVYTDVSDNQVLVSFVNGVQVFVGELPDGRFISVGCDLDVLGVCAFASVESFKAGLKSFGC